YWTKTPVSEDTIGDNSFRDFAQLWPDGRVMTELRPLQARRLVLMRSQFNLLRLKSVIAYKLCFFNRNEDLLVA
ncbi:hypothetical protein ACQWR8_004808, partial [Escherichia coli]